MYREKIHRVGRPFQAGTLVYVFGTNAGLGRMRFTVAEVSQGVKLDGPQLASLYTAWVARRKKLSESEAMALLYREALEGGV